MPIRNEAGFRFDFASEVVSQKSYSKGSILAYTTTRSALANESVLATDIEQNTTKT